ncbi:MAG: hypothetical protein FJX76_26280 [Armatimonadetes bacterium]|nr:hypothetical protein [Armatimonadota bacterium]
MNRKRVLVVAQTVQEYAWANRQAAMDAWTEWTVLYTDETAIDRLDPGNRHVGLIFPSALDLDAETIWCTYRSMLAELWSEVDARPARQLHLVNQLNNGYVVLERLYAEALVSAAVLHCQPDEIRIPPLWTSELISRLRPQIRVRWKSASFDHLQSVVKWIARRRGVACKMHWSALLQDWMGPATAVLGQALLFVAMAGYDVIRILAWLKHAVSRVLAPAGSTDSIRNADREPIVFSNADSDLDRQFKLSALDADFKQMSVMWSGLDSISRLGPPAWRQQPLVDYLEGKTTADPIVSSPARASLPTLVTPLLLPYLQAWYSSALQRPQPRGVSARLWRLIGCREMAHERLLTFRRIAYSTRQFAHACDVFASLRPRLFLAGDTVESHRALTLAARARDVPSAATSHGLGLRLLEFKPTPLADVNFRFQGTFGVDGSRIGHPEVQPAFYDSVSLQSPAPRRVQGAAPQHVVIVTSLYSHSPSMFTLGLFIDPQGHAAQLKSLVDRMAQSSEHTTITIKSHPLCDDHGLYDLLAAAYPTRVRHRREAFAPEDFEADVVVLYNCSSTAFFSIVSRAIPVVAHWGAMTQAARRLVATTALIGSHDSVEVACLVQELLSTPQGKRARDAREAALSVWNRFIPPSAGGLDAALEFAWKQFPQSEAAGGSLAR